MVVCASRIAHPFFITCPIQFLGDHIFIHRIRIGADEQVRVIIRADEEDVIPCDQRFEEPIKLISVIAPLLVWSRKYCQAIIFIRRNSVHRAILNVRTDVSIPQSLARSGNRNQITNGDDRIGTRQSCRAAGHHHIECGSVETRSDGRQRVSGLICPSDGRGIAVPLP